MLNAEIIAVGSEMLTAGRIDTNSLFLTEHLNSIGIEVTAKHVVGDDRARLTLTIQRALTDSQLVILSGGLGPTEDDLTREAVADAIGCTLASDSAILEKIESRFRLMNRKMPEINRRQAMVLEGARVLSNSRGTAPGQWIEASGRVVILLPGPPNELKAMFLDECLPALTTLAPPASIRTLTLRVTGMSESQLDEAISSFYKGVASLETTVLAHHGDLTVILRARCATSLESEALVAHVGEKMLVALGDNVYSRNGDPLETVIGKKLLERGETLVVAESATGGGLADRITSVAGSSAYFLGSLVTYTKQLKMELLGIPEALLTEFGTVSAETAEAMAIGVRNRTGATWAISITGNAGPSTDGSSSVGTIYTAVAGPGGTKVTHRVWPANDRMRVRAFAGQLALDLLNRELSLPLEATAKLPVRL